MRSHANAFSKTVLAILLAGIASLSFAKVHTDDSKLLLGVINFGKTTIPEFTKALTKKGCFVQKGITEAMVKEQCFLLPGNPTVAVDSEEGAPIDMVTLTYKKGLSNAEYDAYLNSLCEAYGQPRHQETNAKTGYKYAVWVNKGMIVELEEPTLSFEGYLTYMTPADYGQAKNELIRKQ